jgi:flagellum-specific ATP synthase
MTAAERFRDEGAHVLLLVDSVTRFAEAQREVALAAGEEPSLRGFPPSMAGAVAGLVERAGPGPEGSGDVTGVFSVLVAGSDMEEPVADTLRGLLDGHVVLDRAIAERGRFPAVDVPRSVSRSLPGCVSAEENVVLAHARRLMGAYDRSELMVRSGLYTPGADAELDAAVRLRPAFEAFLAEPSEKPEAAVGRLAAILSGAG